MQNMFSIKRKPRLRDQVRYRILKMIRESGMRPGDRLLSEKKLGQSFKVNHLTIRAALSDLEKSGVVERRPGSGTFLTHSIKTRENKNGVSAKLAVIALREEEHFFSKIRNGIIHELEKDGYMCLSSNLSEAPEILVEQLISLQNRGVSTLVIDYAECKYPEMIEFLNSEDCHFEHIVRVLGNGSITESLPGIRISADYAGAYHYAIGKLKELGHHKIAFFCGSTARDYDCGRANQKYIELYTSAMIDHNLAEYIMVRKGTIPEEFDRAIEELINIPDRPTAILADMDYRGIRLVERAREMKIKVPEELSIIGFNDTPWSEHFDLSTFRFRYKEIGEAVAKAVNNKLGSKSEIIIPIDYIEKKTVAPAR